MTNRFAHFLVQFLVVLFAVGSLMACAEDKAPPELVPPRNVTGKVNQTLSIDLVLNNPDGVSVEWTVDAPNLPNFDSVSELSVRPSGATFTWTPNASHVGRHELVFTVTSTEPAASSSHPVIVEIVPDAAAAPVFVRPGFGGTFDLSRDPCVAFDIEVRDSDSLDVEIKPDEPLPQGATLENVDGNSKRAEFKWCPSEEQVQRSTRWPIKLVADDGDHLPPTPHEYLVVLRVVGKTNCPGTPPVVTVVSPAEGAVVSTPGGYAVDITVSDDVGVRDAPILYYSTTSPPDNPSVADFESQREFMPGGSRDAFRAVIPQLDLPQGQEKALFFMVSVTDNDDETGTACDHVTETRVQKFVAQGADPNAKVANCNACSASLQCESGICAAEAGGTCLPRCAEGCAAGTCQQLATIDGQSLEGCGDVAAVCQGVGECTNDGSEPNDTFAQATPISDGVVAGQICSADFDVYLVETTGDLDISVVLSNFEVTQDLDLAMWDANGEIITVSSSTDASEAITYCLPAEAQKAYIGVYAYDDSGQSAFELNLATAAGSCCVDDANESDDTFETARAVGSDGSFDGTICPANDDWYKVVLTEPALLTVEIIFDAVDVDLDLEFYGLDRKLEIGAYTDGEDETLTFNATEAGTYFFRVTPYGNGSAEYVGALTIGPPGQCTSSKECADYNVCNAGQCQTDACGANGECPNLHVCEKSGPTTAATYCTPDCFDDTDCKASEACKWFPKRNGCGKTGTKAAGESCTFYEDCSGDRICVALPKGYCARAGCVNDENCGLNSFCAPAVDTTGDGTKDLNICVRRCGNGEPSCRESDGYSCSTVTSVGGNSELGCLP